LPTRAGLTKVNAMVCPSKGSSSTSTLYSLDAALLDKHGLDQFFHGKTLSLGCQLTGRPSPSSVC